MAVATATMRDSTALASDTWLSQTDRNGVSCTGWGPTLRPRLRARFVLATIAATITIPTPAILMALGPQLPGASGQLLANRLQRIWGARQGRPLLSGVTLKVSGAAICLAIQGQARPVQGQLAFSRVTAPSSLGTV